AVEFVEEGSNEGTFVVLGPPSQGRIQLLYQLRCLSLSAASRQHPHPIPESSNGFACGICDQPFWVPSLNNAAGNLAFPARSHHSVSQKIKSLLNVHNPRLLRIQPHTQPFQYSIDRRNAWHSKLTRFPLL